MMSSAISPEIRRARFKKATIMNAVPIPVVVRKRSSAWSIVMSILMIVAGLLAIALPFAAGIAANIFVGWMLVFSGGAHIVFAWHRRNVRGLLWEVLLAGLYVFVGGYLLLHPLLGLLSLTLALAIYLFIEAILETTLAFTSRPVRGWGWLLFDGIVTLALSFLIWLSWPASTEWAVGLLIGVSILFTGISRLMVSLIARQFATAV
jgi:uncharacterized membrane protein HdeD (DUF308 family)